MPLIIKLIKSKDKKMKNPYELIYWDINKSQKQIDINNIKFWNWEYKNGNLK